MVPLSGNFPMDLGQPLSWLWSSAVGGAISGSADPPRARATDPPNQIVRRANARGVDRQRRASSMPRAAFDTVRSAEAGRALDRPGIWRRDGLLPSPASRPRLGRRGRATPIFVACAASGPARKSETRLFPWLRLFVGPLTWLGGIEPAGPAGVFTHSGDESHATREHPASIAKR